MVVFDTLGIRLNWFKNIPATVIDIVRLLIEEAFLFDDYTSLKGKYEEF